MKRFEDQDGARESIDIKATARALGAAGEHR
jgi:hypothetical protein